ncbi:hypothetical protein LPJ78_004206 [Coemansia sp. RSA 989]|nr:hypothetical protein LPJ68_003471 [Coemansia sp. RSA 1086]KAJ1749103.1 hypothetical protein LPJ79_003981 [Coemansia sp. RSA 1821]KAJ1863188.1 hypothetical protein LPJ78_004206 [Coemansia sp. RSA 989]KAJ1870979.1 hypothetical protein LPJ55_004236 [Coemansia sp. RSA 990]KAJ2668456.1 hypothetical protein IWW42_005186 [Coemansia sp. RSA 1085]
MMLAEDDYRLIGEEPNEEVLYEDRYLIVHERALVIKRYYFPSLGSRAIPWNKIERVQIARDADVKWYELKMWGMGFGTIWWNCKPRVITWNRYGRRFEINGLSQILATNIVVGVKNSWIRPGTFAENPQQAMAAIGRLLYRNPHLHSE